MFTPTNTDIFAVVECKVKLNVNKADSTVTAPTANTLTYDGSDQALVTAGSSTDGQVQYSLNENGTYNTDIPTGKNAGDYTVWYKVAGDDNHNDTTPEKVDVTIAQKEAVLSWSNTSLPYNGNAQSPAATVTNLESGDTCTVTVTGEQTNMGENYTATATSLSNSNYKLPSNNTTSFAITKPIPTLSNISAEAITYGQDLSASTVSGTATGLNNEPVTGTWAWSVSTTKPTVPDSGKTEYDVTFTSTDSAYDSTTGKVTLTVNPKEVGLNWGTDSFTYDGKAHAPTVTAGDLVDGDTCTVTVEGAQTNAGTYTATATDLTGESAANYKLPSDASHSFTITPREVELSWSDLSFVYDGETHVPTATITNLATSTDVVEFEVEGEQTNAGTHTATATNLSNANYKLPENASQEFEIAKAPQSAPAAPKVSAATSNRITVKAVTGQEYSIDSGKTWRKDGTFKGLKANTSYKIVARKRGDSNHFASPASKPVSVRTKNNAAQNLNSGLKVTQTGSRLNVKWGKVDDATSYEVWVQYCGIKYGTDPTLVVKASEKRSVSFTKLNDKKLKLTKNFRVYVVAKNGKDTLGTSITAHVVGRKNKWYTNAKRIDLITKSFELKKGKTATIKAKTVLVNPKRKQLSDEHAREFRYASSDKSVAKVDKNGKIKAVGKGNCVVFVYSRNGLAQKVKVTVK